MAWTFTFSEKTPQGKLSELVSQVGPFFQTLIHNGDEITSFSFIPTAKELLKDAFSETSPKFGELRDALLNASYDTLAAIGLTGASLDLKLAILEYWCSMLPDMGRRALRRILDALNSIFGSIASAFSAAEPIKELKEAIENAIAD